ncbi:MAG: hypothetical protein V4524_03765 [Patescibacteria group bacterium]
MSQLSLDRLLKDTKRIINANFWIPQLNSDTSYARIHDDHDGTNEGTLAVYFDSMGDAFVSIQSRDRGPGRQQFSDMLRFRTFGGGGMSLRTRNALMILAEAIRLDNEERPLGDPVKNPIRRQ